VRTRLCHLLLAVGSAWLPVPALGLEGRIVNEQGAPLVNVEVSILGRIDTARTDAEGRFTLKPDPAPPFELLVILPGGRYMKPVLVETLPAEEPLVIQVSPFVEESVTVTAGAAPNIELAPAAGATTLSSREIEVRQPVTLTQVLENVPGVSTVSEGQAAVPAIRGLARGRTLILIDGGRVSAERRVGPSATYLDPFLLEDVEVSRGAGSVAYGSDAFGGVIHLRTRRAEPNTPSRFRFTGSWGAGVPQARAGAEFTRGWSRGGAILMAHFRDLDDYRSPEGEVFNSGARDQGFLARADQALGKGWLSVGWQSDFGRDIDRPRTNSSATRFYYPTEDSHRFTASYDLGPLAGFNELSFSGFAGSYRVVTDQDTFPTATAPRQIERADVAARDFGVRATAERFLGSARLEFGLDLNGRFDLEAADVRTQFDLSGNVASSLKDPTIENAHRTDLGLYLVAEAPATARLTLAGGIRGDRATTRNRGGYFGDFSTANGAVSGFASVTAGAFGGFSITGQLSRGFRDPVLSDRYFRGVTGRGFITGNPDLEPETSLQVDFALRYTGGRYRWALYGYQYRIVDLIERYETSTDFFFFRNRGRARLRGVELELQAKLPRDFSLELGAQISEGLALDEGTPLDDVSPAALTLQIRKEIGGRGFVQLRGAVYGRDQEPGPTERLVAGYGLLDAAAGWRLGSKLELRLLARNLFDKDYLVSPDARAVLAPGVSVLITALIKL